ESPDVVVALGGGAYADPVNRDLVRDLSSSVFFLEAPIDELLRRCLQQDAARPLCQDPELFRRLYAAREDSYRLGSIPVPTSGCATSEVVERILSLKAFPQSSEVL